MGAQPLDTRADEEAFLSGRTYAVVGASRDRAKFGNRVLRAYLEQGYLVVPVNPREREVEGLAAVPSLAHLPRKVDGISIVTPPDVSGAVAVEALTLGYRNLWFQPGAEHLEAVRAARAAGARVLAYGPCVLVALAERAARG